MLSADAIYNQIVANIEKNLPIAIKRPVSYNTRKSSAPKQSDSSSTTLSESFVEILDSATGSNKNATGVKNDVTGAKSDAGAAKATAASANIADSAFVSQVKAAAIKEVKTTGTVSERIEAAMRAASEKYNIEYALIKGIIKAESDFNPNCNNGGAGAEGLMQLMPVTAAEVGVTDPYNIEQNIDGGAKYFRKMLDRFNGDVSLALAAYNAGPGNVNKYGGIPPFKETQTYVPRVLTYADYFRQN